MNTSPLASFHAEHGAALQETEGWAVPMDYGNTSEEEINARKGAGLIDLPQVQTVTLNGPDARRFSNGMFTNNIRNLQPGEGNRSAMCDDRGRVQGLIDIYCTDDNRFDGVLEGVSAEWFEGRYEMYIVFDDVEMTVSEQAPWVLSLQGPQASAILAEAQLPQPAENGAHILSDDGIRVACKDRTGLGGFDLLVPTEAMETTVQRLLQSGATLLGHSALDALRISHGRARWPIDGTEKSMVHELAINEEVCNFNKGCYLGQEVINRIDVKGQVVKRLSKISLDGDVLPPVGSSVFLDDSSVGRIASSARSEGQCIALAVLRKIAWEAGTSLRIETDSEVLSGQVASLTQ
jgi:folate-binding protein YgfZ